MDFSLVTLLGLFAHEYLGLTRAELVVGGRFVQVRSKVAPTKEFLLRSALQRGAIWGRPHHRLAVTQAIAMILA